MDRFLILFELNLATLKFLCGERKTLVDTGLALL